MFLKGTQLFAQAMTFRIFWLPATESKWGWFLPAAAPRFQLPTMCAACWPQQLPRRASWGIVGFSQRWEPCLNLRLFHYPGQFSESSRQPALSHFWKTNTNKKKNPTQNSQTELEKIFQVHWKSKYCATEQLWTAYAAFLGCTFILGHSLSSVTVLIAHGC